MSQPTMRLDDVTELAGAIAQEYRLPVHSMFTIRDAIRRLCRKAVDDDRAFARARFHLNAYMPTTWEWEALAEVREAEREACANVAEAWASQDHFADGIAAAIRAREGRP